MKTTSKITAALALTTMLVSAGAWAGKSGGTDAWARAGAVVKAMQGDEKLILTKGIMPLPLLPNAPPPPADAVPGAGYIAGIPRLKIPALKETDEDRYKQICTEVRDDGAYVDQGEQDNLIVQKIEGNPNAIGATANFASAILANRTPGGRHTGTTWKDIDGDLWLYGWVFSAFFLGNLIVVVPMVLNAHAGTRYGIPFPVLCRASFGTVGANIPALLRALVACGWFGIQTWIGGDAIYKILGVFAPAITSGTCRPPSEA